MELILIKLSHTISIELLCVAKNVQMADVILIIIKCIYYILYYGPLFSLAGDPYMQFHMYIQCPVMTTLYNDSINL